MEALYSGLLPKQQLWTPPGTTKSTIAGVCFPAWCWAKDPTLRFLIATNADDIADRDSLACRNVIQSEWYQSTFCHDDSGNRIWGLSLDQNEKANYSNTATGFRVALTTGKTVTGKKGDILIVDDPHDVKKVSSKVYREAVITWFREAFYNRVNDFINARRGVIGQRTDMEDLQSSLCADGGWSILSLPERFDENNRISTVIFDDARDHGELLRPEEFRDKEEADAILTMGPLSYAAQHLQRPESRTGRMFDRDKVRMVPTYPVGTSFVRFWDTAASTTDTACFSAGCLMGRTPEGRYIIADHIRGRWVPSDRNRIMRNSGLQDMYMQGMAGYHMYFEKGASDAGVERDAHLVSYLSGIPVTVQPSKGDKIVRATPLSSQWAGGNVDVVIGEWNRLFFQDMEGFPGGSKDTTDAASGAFNRLWSAVANFEPTTAEDHETEEGQLPSYTFNRSR